MNTIWSLILGVIGLLGTVITLINIFIEVDSNKKVKLSPRKMVLLIVCISVFCFGVNFFNFTSNEETLNPSETLSTVPSIEDNIEVDGEADKKFEDDIIEIRATITTKQLFPGDQLNKEALFVEGTTLSGESVLLSDFEFAPNIIMEGENEITITYENLTYVILYSAHSPQLVRIEAKYVGESLQKGDEILPEYFSVVGIYEDGNQIEQTDFLTEPSTANSDGYIQVTISKGEIKTHILVYVEELPQNSLICTEQHFPTDMTWVNITKWSDTDDLDINGRRYSGGLKIEISEIFSSLGATIGRSLISKIAFTNDTGKPLVGNLAFIIVVDQTMFSSLSSGTISVLIDGEEKFNTGRIDSSTTGNFAVDVDVDGADSMIIMVDAEIKAGAFTFGIVDE